MTLFQVAAVTVLAALFVRDVWRWGRSPLTHGLRLLRLAAWAAAAVTIAEPDLLQAVATVLGIGRAADVVLYLTALGGLWVAFYLYTRCLRLEREITALTRHLAIRDATPPAGGPEPSSGRK